jgi:heat shock protein HtpX
MSKWMAKKSYNLTIIQQEQVESLNKKEQAVWFTVLELAERNHIKMPEVAIYQDSEANAFATGPSKNKSLVAVSTGLLESMDNDAIE